MVLCTYLYIRPQMLNLLRLLQRFWMWLRFRDWCSSSTPKWGQAFLYGGVVILKQEKDKPNLMPQERKWCFSSSKINLLNKLFWSPPVCKIFHHGARQRSVFGLFVCFFLPHEGVQDTLVAIIKKKAPPMHSPLWRTVWLLVSPVITSKSKECMVTNWKQKSWVWKENKLTLCLKSHFSSLKVTFLCLSLLKPPPVLGAW